MSDSRGRSYSDVGSRFLFKMASNVAVSGTAASITALDTTQWRVNFNCRVIGLSAYFKTGGTAAGPVILLQRSLAGTGAWTSIGTLNVGTRADSTGAAASVTETDLAEGDLVRFAIAAGTAASTPTFSATIDLIENFVSA
jgi:hypothetical protein